MCGICGIWYFDPARHVEPGLLHAMTDRLRHRGPDDAGYFCDGTVGLGVRRLAIVGGAVSHQPVSNEVRSVVLVGNGEIYNYHELKTKEHNYRTPGDMETIVHLYEDTGQLCVNALRGMFAFALWDSRTSELMLAVDRFGKKPLYYFRDAEKLVFASELKALRAIPGFPLELDLQALDEYLAAGYITAPRTIYVNVSKFSPGQIMTVQRDGAANLRQYWSPRFAQLTEWDRRSERDLAAELRFLLEDAVRVRLLGDEAPGAFLSGGVDSTSVVALMTHVGGRPVKTFSLGFHDSAYDESTYALRAASELQTEHVTQTVDATALDLLPELVRQFDEPFADSSMIPTYLVSRLARTQVKAVLGGDGGDEVFGGYHQHLYAYRQHYLQSRLPYPLHVITGQAARAFPRRMKLMPYFAALGQSPERWLTSGFFAPGQRLLLYAPEVRSMLNVGDFEAGRHAMFHQLENLDPLSQVQHHDITCYLSGDILVKVDRASMYTALEVRSPLLDHKVFEFMAGVQPSSRIGLRSGKTLLRRALKPLLPAFIHKSRKHGFSIPQAEWLRGPLKPFVRELPSSRYLAAWFNPGPIQELVDTHLDGHVDHKDRLWALICLDIWARNQ